MAGPVPNPEALQNALLIEQKRQRMDDDTSSKDTLLDEEGIALKDLSHQRKQAIANQEARPTATISQLRSSVSMGQAGSRGDGNHSQALTMGKLYEHMGKLSIIPRYLVYILPMAMLIAVPLVIGALIPKAELGGVRLVWLFMWVEIVWLSLWVSKIFAKLLPSLFKFFIGFVSAGTAKYATIIKALEVPITLVSWAFVSFITFIPIMTRNPTQRSLNDTAVKGWEGTLRQILAALTVIALVYLGQKMFIQLVAVNFHKVSYEERIHKNKAAVHILARLYEQSRAISPTFTNDFRREDEILTSSKFHHQSTIGTATPTMRAVLGGAKKAVNKATSVIGSAAHEITGKHIFQPTSPYNVVVDALATSNGCSTLAQRLWYSFAAEGEEVVHQQDFEEVLGNAEEAREVMLLFDKDGNGDINLDEAELVVAEIGKERKALARSMRDVDSAIGKLDNALVIVVFIIAVFIMVSFLNNDFTTTLATAGTALLSLSFIFAVTCQEILLSILFLFYKHPFDVGDRVDISGTSYVVKELSLLFTVFKRLDGTIVQVNNAVLNTAWIENIRRSNTISERVQLSVEFCTTFCAIQKLRQEMLLFVRSNSRDYASDLEVEILDAKGLDKLLLQVVIKHKSNWQNDALRAHRKNKFMCALVQAIRKVGIKGAGAGLGDVSNPMHIVRTSALVPKELPSEGASSNDVDTSLDQRRLLVEDPSTEIDDDRQPHSGYDYYSEDYLDKFLSETTANDGPRGYGDVNRGKSFGRRRKPAPDDLENGREV